ncbi:MAG: STAS domain-containing protein [Acidimicrobiales bacterium]
MDLEVTFDITHQEDQPLVLAVTGEIDVFTAPQLRQQLIDLANAGHTTVIMDMEKVEFLDSTGLGVLVGGLKRLRGVDGDLILVSTQPRVVKVLEITGLTRVFKVYDRMAEALADNPVPAT